MLRFASMFATRLRPMIAMLLLGVLSLVVLPRELFHDCVLEHAHCEAPNGAEIAGADCSVCHKALPVYQVEVVVVVERFRQLVAVRSVALVAQTEGGHCEATSSRGPPLC